MRFLALTIWKEMKRRFNDPLGLFMWFMIPLVLGGLLTSVLGGSGGPAFKPQLLLTDQDQTLVSQAIPQALTSADIIEITEVGFPEGEEIINAGEASAHLIIPDGFAAAYLRKEPIALKLVTNPAQNISPRLIRDLMQSVLDLGHYIQLVLGDEIALIIDNNNASDLTITDVSTLISTKIEAIQPYALPPSIVVEDVTPEPEGNPINAALLMFPGIIVMAIVFAGQGISGIYWQDRDKGILGRWRAGPNGMWVYWTGLFVASMGLLVVVTFPLLVAGFFFFEISFEKFAASVAWIMLAGPVVFAALTIVQVLAPNRNAGNVISTLVVFPLLMAGGSFFPKEALPDYMQPLVSYTPNGNVLEPLKGYFLGDFGASGLFANLLPILGATVVMIFIASVIADKKEAA